MPTESITVNGVDLSSLVRNVESLAGLLRTPEQLGDNLVIPGRHGRLRQAGRTFDAGEIVLPLWVVGADAVTGANLSGDPAVTSYYARVDELVRLLHATTLTVDHTLPDGSVRRAVAEMADEPMDFTRQLGAPLFGRVVVTLTVPDAFWSDLSAVTAGPNVFSTGGTAALTGFAGATAPMDELVVTFGPGANPELTQPASGYLLAYDGVIAAGQQLQVDTATWSVGPGSGSVWTPDVTKVRFGPESRFFSLQPEPGGVAPTVRLTHTGGGQVSVTIVGKRRFLTG